MSFTGTGGKYPGANPQSDLTVAKSNVYIEVTTKFGGKEKLGGFVDMDFKDGSFSELALSGSDGAYPDSNVAYLAGHSPITLLGTTSSGGKGDLGIVAKLTFVNNKFTESVVHRFAGSDGSQPTAGLAPGANGVFFGTTFSGGSKSDGTIYELKPHGAGFTFTSLYSFAGGSDGQYPYAPVIVNSAGALFGTTIDGGNDNMGTVYELSHGKRTITYWFKGGTDGAYPYAGLISDKSGNLYGTATNGGGSSNYGVVFELKRSGTKYKEGVLYRFGTGSDGEYPYGRLLLGAGGVLYGTTEGGGAYGSGTVFELSPRGGKYTETVLHSFAGGTGDGSNPEGGLTDVNGVLYGTTYGGGASNEGTIFSLTP